MKVSTILQPKLPSQFGVVDVSMIDIVVENTNNGSTSQSDSPGRLSGKSNGL